MMYAHQKKANITAVHDNNVLLTGVYVFRVL